MQVLTTSENITKRLATEKACTWLSANITGKSTKAWNQSDLRSVIYQVSNIVIYSLRNRSRKLPLNVHIFYEVILFFVCVSFCRCGFNVQSDTLWSFMFWIIHVNQLHCRRRFISLSVDSDSSDLMWGQYQRCLFCSCILPLIRRRRQDFLQTVMIK